MKIKMLSYAVGAALVLGAGVANAFNINAYPLPGTLDLYIAGSSAQDGSLELYIDSICDAGSADAYEGTNQRMMYCNVSSAHVAGFPVAGIPVLFHKSSGGGSGEGVQPVADQTALADMLPTSNAGVVGDNCGAAVVKVPGGGLPNYNIHTCTNTVTGLQVPDAGISDEEPAQFGATAAELNKLNIQSQDAVIFGIIVTQNLRNVLQAAQGLAVNSETEANMPNLSRSAISSLFGGNIGDWGQLLGNTGHPITDGTYGPAPTGPGGTSVFISRRVSTSGTQVGAQIYFMNQGCSNGVTIFQPGSDGGACGTGGLVNEGSGTSNVKACMNQNQTLGNWAIGIIGVENVPGGADTWRFVKVDNYAPTLLNVENSKYDYVMQNSVQWRNAASGNALAGNKLLLMQKIALENGSPQILTVVDGNITQPWGNTGYMALTPAYAAQIPNPVIPNPVTAAQVLASPVMTMTKAPLGTPNNCQFPQVINNVGL